VNGAAHARTYVPGMPRSSRVKDSCVFQNIMPRTRRFRSKHRLTVDLGSGRQGRNPAGESPAVPVARFRHVVMPRFMTGNRMFIAWCKRPAPGLRAGIKRVTREDEIRMQTRAERGVYAPAFKLHWFWAGSERTSQGQNSASGGGNPTVRDCRGTCGNVNYGGIRNPPHNRKGAGR